MKKGGGTSSPEGPRSASSSRSKDEPRRLVRDPDPDRILLFHFSALSYNAHLIHLDERYSQDVEGRPGLLVHGPLCLTLILEILPEPHSGEPPRAGRPAHGLPQRGAAVCGERMKVCVRSAAANSHQVWIENQHGGLCVKGTVLAEEVFVKTQRKEP
ncbi:hypothetical protein PG994_010029 [Apiospora phragmitis]|uniref:MaoC-like domain-containing protein n=1 Tax=Apiospora phragmitis TaxID=2905665 RepID=A0ABR1TNQ9_9PEZI